MTLLRPNRQSPRYSAHDLSHILGGVATGVGLLLFVAGASSSPPRTTT